MGGAYFKVVVRCGAQRSLVLGVSFYAYTLSCRMTKFNVVDLHQMLQCHIWQPCFHHKTFLTASSQLQKSLTTAAKQFKKEKLQILMDYKLNS